MNYITRINAGARTVCNTAVVTGMLLFLSGPLLSTAQAQLEADASQSSPAQKSTSQVAKPKVIVAKFHADWCGSCKQMGTVMEDMQNKFDGEQALFVTFDLTNGTTKHQSELLGAALGREKLWSENNGSTGVIKVVDAESKNVVTSFNKDNSLKDMTATISAAIK